MALAAAVIGLSLSLGTFSLWFWAQPVWVVNKGHQCKETAMKMGRVNGCKADALQRTDLCALSWLEAASSGRLAMLPAPLAAPAGQVARDNTEIYAANKTRLFLCNLSYCHCMFLNNASHFLPSGHVFSNLLPSAQALWVWQEAARAANGVDWFSSAFGCWLMRSNLHVGADNLPSEQSCTVAVDCEDLGKWCSEI